MLRFIPSFYVLHSCGDPLITKELQEEEKREKQRAKDFSQAFLVLVFVFKLGDFPPLFLCPFGLPIK